MVSDSRSAPEDRVVVASQVERDEFRRLFPQLADMDHDGTLGLLGLGDELNTIRSIVATTARFTNALRSEAAWNGHIHCPILRLAVSSMPSVAAENITQASIAEAFVPAARGELDTPGGEMTQKIFTCDKWDFPRNSCVN